MIIIKTDNPVALDSADHQHPLGCIADNNSDINYVSEVKRYFNNNQIKILDLGCSGGQIVVDHLNLGDVAVGLEGSSNVLNGAGRHNWEKHHNKNLFLCDITQPFECLENEQNMLFDCIQMWEVLEHISFIKMEQLFKNILTHLKDDGIFIGSIATCEDPPRHVSLFNKDTWVAIFKNNGLEMKDYGFNSLPRSVHSGHNGFVFSAKKLKV
jgi:2-polyprenyl-3-methyl-5-hydroxy-6-metoxy-1,4-benzoquinol methylase